MCNVLITNKMDFVLFVWFIKNQYHYTIIDERIIELYRFQLAVANEEKGMLYAQVKTLTEEVSMLRQSMEQSRQAIDDLLFEIKSLCKKGEERDKRIADLE